MSPFPAGKKCFVCCDPRVRRMLAVKAQKRLTRLRLVEALRRRRSELRNEQD